MRRLVPFGVAAFVLGVAAMVEPSLIPVSIDRAIISLVGLLALVQVYGVVASGLREERYRAETPDPEVLTPSPVSGEDGTDAFVGTFADRWYTRRSELREAAVAVLTRYAGLTESAARRALADGSWTDDPVAAAHLSDDAPPVPVRQILGRLVSRESAYRSGRRRAIQAIAARAGVSPSEGQAGARRLHTDAGERGPPERIDDEEPRRRGTGHWRGVSAVALLAVGVGALTEVAAVVLAGVVGIGFAAYARAASDPAVDVEVERTLEREQVNPGEAVEVTLAVRNAGEGTLPDLRIVDGVPGALTVASGSPRLGTALRAGETTTLTYEVEARRGVHEFAPTTVIARDVAGVAETERSVPAESRLVCVPTLRPTTVPVPLRRSATQYAGQVQTPSGGEGVEFYATRTYQPGDPTNRIDWNRRARTGELATLEFREERAATVVVVVDVRGPSYVAPGPYAPHAVDHAVGAAGRVFASLLDDGNRVGVAAFGADCWLPPGTGTAHRARARDLLATDPGLASDRVPGMEPGRWRRRFERRLPTDAQLVVLSPLADAGSVRLVRRMDARGHPSTVISPDPTVAAGTDLLLASVARRVRVTDLRRAGVPVVDWDTDEPLDSALARAGGRRPP